MTPEEFRAAGYAVIDWIADYRARVSRGEFPVQAPATPGALEHALPARAPELPEPAEAILADFARLIPDGITHWQHPAFFGYFPANAALASLLGDFLSSGLGVIGLNWQSSPALTELETTMLRWMRELLGLSPQWSGVLQDSASTSSLVALLCARERTTTYGAARGGLQSVTAPLIVYASEQAHSSVEKAAALAGFGRDHVRAVPTDAEYALSVPDLERLMREDRARGRVPCAVVATTGTTSTTAMDPIAALAAVTQREECWLHVDAAMAGSAMMLPEFRGYWAGIDGADSIVVNAHKWLGSVFDTSLYFVRDPQHLIRVMSTNPSYLQSAVDGEVINYRDWGIPLGRRFRALKLWFLLRAEGAERLRERLRRDLRNARWLAEQVAQTPHWRVVAPVKLQTVCLRHEPPGLDGAALDAHTQTWAARLNASGSAYVTPARIDGRWMVRVSIGAEATEHSDVASLWQILQATVAARA